MNYIARDGRAQESVLIFGIHLEDPSVICWRSKLKRCSG